MNQTTKTLLIAVIVAVVAFWGGMAYAKHKSPAMTAGQGQYGMGQGRGFGGGRGGANGGFVGGTVLSKTDTTITVQNQNGGSKIILVSPTTTVSKSAQGALSDVAVGSSILVTGTPNSDGSITAQTLQIRPAAPAGTSAKAAQ